MILILLTGQVKVEVMKIVKLQEILVYVVHQLGHTNVRHHWYLRVVNRASGLMVEVSCLQATVLREQMPELPVLVISVRRVLILTSFNCLWKLLSPTLTATFCTRVAIVVTLIMQEN